MKTSFLLGRHGQTQWNVIKKLQGQLNSPITETGYNQAQTLAQSLKEDAPDVIVTSPLPRARITAEVCQLQLDIPLIEHQGLVERHFGDWQGCLFESLNNQPYFEEIFFQVTEHAPPNGESGLGACKRFEDTLRELAQEHSGKSILVITHGDLLRCLLTELRQAQFCDAYSQYGNGQVFNVIYDHESGRFLV